MKPQSVGGQIMAVKQRDAAIKKYYKNPNICKFCKSIIEVGDYKVSQIKKKKFCNNSCSSKHNNRTRTINKKRETKYCSCSAPIPKKRNKCNTCASRREIHLKTKGELFGLRKNWQSARSSIRRDANSVYNKSKKKRECKICKYDKHVDVCHIIPVKEFSDDTLIGTINDIKNLVTLCPNHHWEFDNKLITIEK